MQMMYLDEIFELLVFLFAASFMWFFFWWMQDIYKTNLAVDAARVRLQRIGISPENPNTPRDISERFRSVIAQKHISDHDVFILFASLYLLRRSLRLGCNFFARELAALPSSMRQRLLDSSQGHINQADVKHLLSDIEAPRMAFRIAERFEENMHDLRREMKARRLFREDGTIETEKAHEYS
jgi:hypothetical protein